MPARGPLDFGATLKLKCLKPGLVLQCGALSEAPSTMWKNGCLGWDPVFEPNEARSWKVVWAVGTRKLLQLLGPLLD